MLAIADIRIDGDTQARVCVDQQVVNQYVDAMEGGAKFPPVDVFFDGNEYWLADGFHRFEAAANLQRVKLSAKIHEGSQQDAQWFSLAANKTNGLQRTNADKAKCVKAALAHPASARLSDEQIAKHVGVNPTTVASHRKSISGNPRDSKQERTVTRGGTTYTQNVTNIGKREEVAAEQVQPASHAAVEHEQNQIEDDAADAAFVAALMGMFSEWSWIGSTDNSGRSETVKEVISEFKQFEGIISDCLSKG